MTFEAIHQGREGHIKCVDDKKEYIFEISCENSYGYFGIWIKGLSKKKKELIKVLLREWLNRSGRENWYFEN